MPLYDYKCPEHGVFQELAGVDECASPAACPHCGKLSGRIIMIPPEVLAMSPLKRKAKEANERAQHEPIKSTADSRLEAQERKAHSCGCSSHRHGHQHSHKTRAQQHEQSIDLSQASKSALQQQVVYMPDGSKVFPSQRPWMISH